MLVFGKHRVLLQVCQALATQSFNIGSFSIMKVCESIYQESTVFNKLIEVRKVFYILMNLLLRMQEKTACDVHKAVFTDFDFSARPLLVFPNYRRNMASGGMTTNKENVDSLGC